MVDAKGHQTFSTYGLKLRENEAVRRLVAVFWHLLKKMDSALEMYMPLDSVV